MREMRRAMGNRGGKAAKQSKGTADHPNHPASYIPHRTADSSQLPTDRPAIPQLVNVNCRLSAVECSWPDGRMWNLSRGLHRFNP